MGRENQALPQWRSCPGEPRTGKGACPQGAFVQPRQGIGEAAQVPDQPGTPGCKVMAQGHGLRPLQMGVTGHHRFNMFFRLIQKRPNSLCKFGPQRRYRPL
ncbi:hypothetical protein FACS189496_2930 [Bacilli bacterium]|nr:hypothetical protein FACS189496_2930 [Bacilli bacterium]